MPAQRQKAVDRTVAFDHVGRVNRRVVHVFEQRIFAAEPHRQAAQDALAGGREGRAGLGPLDRVDADRTRWHATPAQRPPVTSITAPVV